jgi:hypothetical protein
MRKPYRVQEFDRLQTLPRDFTQIADVKASVFVVFDEVIEAFAQWFEYKTHICYLLAPSVYRPMHEPLF